MKLIDFYLNFIFKNVSAYWHVSFFYVINSNSSNSNRRRNWNDVEYTALEDYQLLAVLSESDDNTT